MNRRKLDRMMTRFRSYDTRVHFFLVMPASDPNVLEVVRQAKDCHRSLSSFKDVVGYKTDKWVVLEVLGKVFDHHVFDNQASPCSLAKAVRPITAHVHRWMNLVRGAKLYYRWPPQLFDAYDTQYLDGGVPIGCAMRPLPVFHTSEYRNVVTHIKRRVRAEHVKTYQGSSHWECSCGSTGTVNPFDPDQTFGDHFRASCLSPLGKSFSLYDVYRRAELIMRVKIAESANVLTVQEQAELIRLTDALRNDWGYQGSYHVAV